MRDPTQPVNELDRLLGNANLSYSMNMVAVNSMIPPKLIHIRSGYWRSRAKRP